MPSITKEMRPARKKRYHVSPRLKLRFSRAQHPVKFKKYMSLPATMTERRPASQNESCQSKTEKTALVNKTSTKLGEVRRPFSHHEVITTCKTKKSRVSPRMKVSFPLEQHPVIFRKYTSLPAITKEMRPAREKRHHVS